MNLYLKYRPRKISELDLENVRNVLTKAIKGDKLAHAYLFTGPRGSGKTSASRILARVVNCLENKDGLDEPCGKCESCVAIEASSAVDIVEIDAASNRGIDDIRELKQKIRLAPSTLSKKVYIIDEVHMLTTEAFNALLKTLEEPPEHALFILCTTEAHKVPETISSRCTNVQFTKATISEMIRALGRVVKGEKAKVTDEALEYLASKVDGSFRDGVKVLDQLLSGGEEVNIDDVKMVLHGGAGVDVEGLANALIEKDVKEALTIYRKFQVQGIDFKYILGELMDMFRAAMLSRFDKSISSQIEILNVKETVELVYLIDDAIYRAGRSQNSHLIVEMMIIKWCEDEGDTKGSSSGDNIKAKSKLKTEEKIAEKVKEVVESEGGVSHDFTMSDDEISERWKKLLKTAEKSSYSVEALLTKSWPRRINGGEIIIEVMYEFHKQQLSTERFRRIVEELVKDVYGFPLKCRFELGDRVSQFSVDDLRRMGDDGNIGKTDDEISESPAEGEDILSVAEEIFVN